MFIRRLSLLFFLLIAVFLPSSVFALNISPVRQTHVIDPGKSQQLELVVKNDDLFTITVVPTVDAFSIDEHSGTAIFGKKDDAIAWVKPEFFSIDLLPGEEKTIVYHAAIPESAEPISHYLALFAEQVSTDGQIGVGSRVGSLVFLHIAGPVIESIVLEDFSASQENLLQEPEVHLRIRNSGSMHIAPKGNIILTNWWGKEIGVYPLNPLDRKVLPGESWDQTYAFTDLVPQAFGKMKMHMNVQYGLEEKNMNAWSTSWYVPKHIFMILSVIILGIFLLLFRAHRHKKISV